MHFEANLLENKTAKTDAFQRPLNSRSEPRTELVAKTSIPQVLARVSLCWPLMTICGQNVDTLRTPKRSNRDFFQLYNLPEIPTILSSPVFLYITPGAVRCLFGFLALWGQKHCGGIYHYHYRYHLLLLSLSLSLTSKF